MDRDTADFFGCRQARPRVVVALLAGDDMDVTSDTGQMKSEIAENLAGGGMVREEEAVEENDALHEDRPGGCDLYCALSGLAQFAGRLGELSRDF